MNVAVTGLNAADTPAPGVAVIRCLKEHPDWQGRIIGLTYDVLEPGILDSHLIDSAYLLPYPKSGKDILLERILYIHKKEHIDAIIPVLDAELPNFIKIKDELFDYGIKLFIPTEEQFTKRSKVNLFKLSQDTGIKVPETHIINDINNFSLKQKDLPVMVKGLFYEAYIANSIDETLYYIHRIASKWGWPVLVQEYIRGEEINTSALGDGRGKMLGVVCMKKLVNTEKGKGWACVTIKNDGFIKLTKRIITTLNWQGAIEVEAIYSKKDNNFYIIELNPRFPAWIYLAKAAGLNLPYMYLKIALGESVPKACGYKTGVVISNYTTNLITDIAKIETLFTNGEIAYEKNI